MKRHETRVGDIQARISQADEFYQHPIGRNYRFAPWRLLSSVLDVTIDDFTTPRFAIMAMRTPTRHCGSRHYPQISRLAARLSAA